MEGYQVEENKRYTAECEASQGYAPKPSCKKCGGFGWYHPLRYDGKVDYTQIAVCNEPECLHQSFINKSL